VALHFRLSFAAIIAVVSVTLVVVNQCNSLQDPPAWYHPCGTRRSHGFESRL